MLKICEMSSFLPHTADTKAIAYQNLTSKLMKPLIVGERSTDPLFYLTISTFYCIMFKLMQHLIIQHNRQYKALIQILQNPKSLV